MAKNEEQSVIPVADEPTTSTGKLLEIIDANTLKAKREQYDEKIYNLANKVIDYEEQGPEYEGIARMLTGFLVASIQLKSMIEVIAAINDAMAALTDAIEFIDEALKFDQNMLAGSLRVKYGFFERRRQRRQIKQARRNNLNRIKTIIDTIKWKYKMALDLVDAFSKLGEEIGAMMSKPQRRKKKRNVGNSFSGNVEVEKILNKIREERNGSSAPASGGAPAAPAGGGSDGGSDTGDLIF